MRLFQLSILLSLSLAATALAQTRPAATEPPSVTAAHIAPAPGGGYVGAERCRSCHGAESIEYAKTPHASLTPAHPDSVTGCDLCHGPGKAHSDAEEAAKGDDAKTAAAAKLIFNFHGNPKQNSERCMQCHQSSRSQQQFAHSEHAMHGVGCNDCHATHLVEAARSPKQTVMGSAQENFFSVPKLGEENRWLHGSLLKKSQPELCYECHGNIRAQFALPTHHRVPEGALKCTDCHNSHGSSNRSELVRNGSETCVQCHVEKRGPFVFEHPASKIEGCVACHTPHGSINRMLLVRREERFLCLQCHVNPIGINLPHSRLSFQTRGDCTRCHASIHGSNFEASLLH
jgi:predicted CXXCH cytochrome family protein